MNKRKLSCIRFFISLQIIWLLAGCVGVPTNTLSNLSKTQAEPRLTLKPCSINEIDAECGYLSVPEDRNNPDGRVLNLKMVVVRAYGPNRQPDPLFYIVGGPGVAVTRYDIVANSHNDIFGKVNAQHDMVFLDQRGTNDKHLLTCEWPSFAIIDAPQQQTDDWMKGCLANLDGDPRFYTTAVAMQDLDEARTALGYDKINLYGISYGAAAVQVYMRMFPEHVRAAVIDHGTALDLPFFYAMPRASQLALDQVFTYCEKDENCHAAYPDIRTDFQAVISRLAKGPVVTSYTAPRDTAPASVTLMGLEEAIHKTLYDGAYGKIPFMTHLLATSEDWTPIVESNSDQGSSSGGNNRFQFMTFMIFCFEPAWGIDPQEITRLNPGSYYLDAAMGAAKLRQMICPTLPKPDPSLIYGPGKPAPLSALIFNSLLDPQNPPSNMDLALKEFTQSRVVVEPAEGHDPFVQHECRWSIMAQYIQQGSVEGLDTACMQEIKPSFIAVN